MAADCFRVVWDGDGDVIGVRRVVSAWENVFQK